MILSRILRSGSRAHVRLDRSPTSRASGRTLEPVDLRQAWAMRPPPVFRKSLHAVLLPLLSMGGLFEAAHAQNPNLQFFRQPDTASAASAYPAFHIGEVTGDGIPDLVRLVIGDRVSIQPGTGNGRFGAASFLDAGLQVWAVTSGLISGDSHADILVANSGDETVGLYFGQPGGGFSPPRISPIGIHPRNMLMLDFDRNGRMDVVFTGYTGDAREGFLKTFLGQADGTFTNGTTYQTSPATLYTEANSVASADFNGDGWPDLVVTNPRTRRSLAVFLNNQAGAFTALPEAMLSGPAGQATTGDFNSDGKADVAFTAITELPYGTTGPDIVIGVGLGNGDGTFTFSHVTGQDGITSYLQNIAARDMDGDGHLDLVITPIALSTIGNRLAIFRGDGAGGFTLGTQFGVEQYSHLVVPSDLNGDGAVDLVVSHSDANIQTYLGLSPISVDLVVTTTADENNGTISPGSGTGTSLREAINHALTQPTPQTITFSSNLSGRTIVLSNVGSTIYGNSAFAITGTADITIQGPATGEGVTISGGGTLRPFFVDSISMVGNPKLTLNDLTLVDGVGSFGGAVLNSGGLVVNRCTFIGNTGSSFGGAIYTGVPGGAAPTASVSNSTFTGNYGSSGGAVLADGVVTLDHVTMSGNSMFVGAALHAFSGAVVTLTNSIVAGHSRDIAVPLQPGSHHNLIGGIDAGGLVNGVNGNLVNVGNAGLRALASNGGPTRTMALAPGSPALDACAAAPGIATDQRGVSRPQGTAPDMGAFESTGDFITVTPSISPDGGIFLNSVQVGLSTTSENATIRYTTDGSAPSETDGMIYTGPFILTDSANVRALAYGQGREPSVIANASFTVRTPLGIWRALHGLAANGSEDLGNPSGDGVANLLKYAFNLAPDSGDLETPGVVVLGPAGLAGLPQIGRDGTGRVTITFIRRKASAHPGVTYTVETGDRLDSLQPLALGGATVESVDDIWERVTVTDPNVTDRRFGRVRVSPEP